MAGGGGGRALNARRGTAGPVRQGAASALPRRSASVSSSSRSLAAVLCSAGQAAAKSYFHRTTCRHRRRPCGQTATCSSREQPHLRVRRQSSTTSTGSSTARGARASASSASRDRTAPCRASTPPRRRVTASCRRAAASGSPPTGRCRPLSGSRFATARWAPPGGSRTRPSCTGSSSATSGACRRSGSTSSSPCPGE